MSKYLESSEGPLSSWQSACLSFVRALPYGFRGKRRLARWLLKLPEGQARVLMHSGNLITVPNLREPVAWSSAIDGLYEPETLSVLKRWMDREGMFVDVGANIGIISLEIAREFTQKRVFAIEAVPRYAELLLANARANGLANVEVHNVLCGETETAETSFWQAPDSHFGMGSRAPQFRSDAEVKLPMRRLDSMLDNQGPVAAIKIDVEGFEAEVIAGAQNILVRDRPPIVFEFAEWAESRRVGHAPGTAQRLLIEMGYQLWTLPDYLASKPPLPSLMLTGGAMLVALAT